VTTDFQRIIIGAGPAALMAATASGSACLILESQSEPGKKLLVSGSGQCNFTHDLEVEEFLARCGKHARFLKPAMYKLGPQDLIQHLAKLGCPSLVRPDGKVFPASMRAVDVRDSLLKGTLQSSSRISYGVKIREVTRREGFLLKDDRSREYRCRELVIACGGASWPQTGSDGSGYELARQLGHRIIEPRPALASVSIQAYPFVSCAGISLQDVSAQLATKTGKHQVSGDLLFTHSGLSGPLILDSSHLLASGDTLRLAFIKDAGPKIRKLLALKPKAGIKNALKATGLPEALLIVLTGMARVDQDKRCAEVTRAELKDLTQVLEALTLKTGKVESLATAMLTAGGVDLAEVRARDMSSILVPGLKFAGEILDYNLPSGGFNIQAACSTGWLAGSSPLN